MKRRTWAVVIGATVATAAVVGFRQRARRSPLPVKTWGPALTQAYGADEAAHLLDKAEARYRELVAVRPPDLSPALRKHTLGTILPGLALYQVMLEAHGGDRQATLKAIEPPFRAWAYALNGPRMRLMSAFPRPFPLFRLAFAWSLKTLYPKEGWDFVQVENDARRLAFDAHSCFYLHTLTAHGAPELTASFCQMDDWMAEMFPAGVAFRRTRTLGRGNECCDFRYELIEGQAVAPELDVALLACPKCHGEPALAGDALTCAVCARAYPIIDGIPHFIEQAALTGQNRRFAYLYDWFSWVYRAFSRAAFTVIGMSEDEGRREVLDRLDPNGGRVLEVSIGPGVNLPYLIGRPDVGEVHGLDISLGQLKRCRSYLRGKGWRVPLYLGNAEELPFGDATFDAVFHIGGINFFNDKAKAIREMVRVAKPGARILICDETERGAKAYEWTLPGFSQSFKEGRPPVSAPVEAVPQEVEELRVFDVWKGWMYCMEFRKPRERLVLTESEGRPT